MTPLKMSEQGINPDLIRERRSATFDVEVLTNIIDGGESMTQRRREIQTKALSDPVFANEPHSSFLSREELYDRAVKKAAHLQKVRKDYDLGFPQENQWLGAIAFPNESSPDSLHSGMFIPTLENQCSDEQKKKWMPKVYSREYLGTYSQTEMGHGTHLRGLETTATYDPSREEFVLHTPTVSAMKWWPGGHGKTTNCAVVMAQLYTQGVNHGTFPFFVIFRDVKSHEPLPGITVGDIGPKMGFNTIDNGFLSLDHFRIPRENMLMKHAEVLKDGTFVLKTKQKKPTYGTMTMVRTFIVYNHGYKAIAQAVTIATRYSAVRHQSELKPGSPEPQIMDYQTQQYKLFPYLSMAYAFKFTADRLFELFLEATGEVLSGNDSKMPELHALSSGLKAYTTASSTQGMEQCRLSCGGHGYSEASGLPKLYSVHVPGCTFEGENTVLLLQTARYLLKCCNDAKSGNSLPDSVSYLSGTTNQRSTINERFTMESLKDAFTHKARRVIFDAAAAVGNLQAKGLEEYDAKNRSGVYLIRAALAHCEMFVVNTFVDSVNTIDDPAIAKVMSQLCQLLAAYHIVNKSGDFLEDGYMSSVQLQIVRDKETALLADIRPNAVALVDAFDFPDHVLDSVLGRYDGQVYENLYKWALKSPLNKTQVHESYYKYLQPMMKSKI